MTFVIDTHKNSISNYKLLYFPLYFADLNHVETGVSEEGRNIGNSVNYFGLAKQ